VPRVQRAPEVRPKQKVSILDSILSEYGRPYAGKECIVEFQCHMNDLARFFCRTCTKTVELRHIDAHCANFLHLFRYIKDTMPCEYKRIPSIENVDERVKQVQSVIKFLQKRVYKQFRPELVILADLEGAFYHYVHQNFQTREIEIEDTDLIWDLNEMQETDYNLTHPQGSSILDAIKHEYTIPSRGKFLDSIESRDIEMQDSTPRFLPQHSKEEQHQFEQRREINSIPDDVTVNNYTMIKIKNLTEQAKNTKEFKVIKKFYDLVHKNTNENTTGESSSAKKSEEKAPRDKDHKAKERDRERESKRKIAASSSVSSELSQDLKNEQIPKRARVEPSATLSVKMEPMVIEPDEVTKPIDDQSLRDKETVKMIKRLLRSDPQVQMSFELVVRLNDFLLRNSERIEKHIITGIHSIVHMYL